MAYAEALVQGFVEALGFQRPRKGSYFILEGLRGG
jgi:hypothetical protein